MANIKYQRHGWMKQRTYHFVCEADDSILSNTYHWISFPKVLLTLQYYCFRDDWTNDVIVFDAYVRTRLLSMNMTMHRLLEIGIDLLSTLCPTYQYSDCQNVCKSVTFWTDKGRHPDAFLWRDQLLFFGINLCSQGISIEVKTSRSLRVPTNHSPRNQ